MGSFVVTLPKGHPLLKKTAADRKWEKQRKERFQRFEEYVEAMVANIVICNRQCKDRITNEVISKGEKALRVEVVCGSTAYYKIETAERLLAKLQSQLKKPVTRTQLRSVWKWHMDPKNKKLM
jgi:hypothetical protein